MKTWPDHNGQPDTNKPYDAMMRWAIDLASKNLNALSKGDVHNLQYEIAWFSMREPTVNELLSGTPLYSNHIPSTGVIEDVQAWLMDSLRSIVDWPTPLPKPSSEVIAHHIPDSFRVLMKVSADAHEPVQWQTARYERSCQPEQARRDETISHFFDLLSMHANNLRRCPCEDCGKIFLKNRVNATCCSKLCSSRYAKRKQLGIPPERFGKRGRPPGHLMPAQPRKPARARKGETGHAKRTR